MIGAGPLGPRSMSLGGPSYCNTSVVGCSVRAGAFGLCRSAWREAWSPAVAVFSLDILHRTYTWSASQTKGFDIVFNKNGACVIWAAAASKVINESLLTGSDGCRWCGGCGGAAAAVATRRRLRSMCDAVTRRCVAAALLTCRRLVCVSGALYP